MCRRVTWQLWLATAALAWLAIGVAQWLGASPLGQDEARFALTAQDYLHGAEPRWYYLAPVMRGVAVPGILLGGDELALRLVPLVLGLAFVAFTSLVALRAFGATTAAWSLAVLAGCRSVIQRSSELLSDLPAAAFLLGGIAILAGELSREGGPRWRIVAAAPLLAIALYIRYGSCVPIAIIGVAAVIVWWREVAQRPWPIVATVAAFVVCLVPHLITATRTMGSPLAILVASRSMPGDDIGLVKYLTENPFRYFGLAAPIPMIAGVLSIFVVRDRRALFVWLVAVGTIVAIGLLTHAQARYILVGTTLLVVLGVDMLIRVARHAGRYRNVVTWSAALAVGISWAICMRDAVVYPGRVRERSAGMFAAVDVVRRDAAGQPCELLARWRMRVEYYSGCVAIMGLYSSEYTRDKRFYAVWTDEPGPQPDFASLPGTHHVLLDTPTARVIRIEP